MRKKISCCKDCQERFIGCHAVCERYIKERDDHIEECREIRKWLSQDAVITSLETERKIKTIKRQRRWNR